MAIGRPPPCQGQGRKGAVGLAAADSCRAASPTKCEDRWALDVASCSLASTSCDSRTWGGNGLGCSRRQSRGCPLVRREDRGCGGGGRYGWRQHGHPHVAHKDGGGATGLVIASGHHTAAPSLRTRTERAVDLAAAAPSPRTRMEGAVDLAPATPSPRTRMEGGGGLGHGGQPPRCLPLVGEEDGRRVLPRRKAIARPPPLQA